MYGTGIGTGTAGGVGLIAGMTVGSWALVVVAIACFAFMLLTLVRNHRRRAAHQRP